VPKYRRNYDGDCFFFTVVTRERMDVFDRAENRRFLSDAIDAARQRWPWEMTAIVLLPDHIHMLWRMKLSDTNYSRRISHIKRLFTRAYLAAGGKEMDVPEGQERKRHRGVWQRKFWEHTIRDARDFQMHMDYIHVNPVKHGFVERPADWPWSSFHRYVREEWYEPDWCGRCELPRNTEYLWPE